MNSKYLQSNFNFYVEHEHFFSTDVEKVWKVMETPSNLELFHPFCLKNPVLKWGNETAIDQIVYLNGVTLKRQFCSWEINKGYDLFIGRVGGRKSFVSWKLNILSANKCKLTIKIYPHFLNQGNKWVQAPFFFIIIYPKLNAYLKSVLQGLSWYIKYKKPIKKNKFGSHDWFS